MIRLGKAAIDLINKLLDTQIMITDSLLAANMNLVRDNAHLMMNISSINRDLYTMRMDKECCKNMTTDLVGLEVPEAEEEYIPKKKMSIDEMREAVQQKMFEGIPAEKRTPEDQQRIDKEARDRAYKIHLEAMEKWKAAENMANSKPAGVDVVEKWKQEGVETKPKIEDVPAQ